jgi:uncharacterized coiled-coil DUF342 family protein
MKFVPLRLFKFLNPVDIENNIITRFEETLRELTRQNSEYHAQIIQLRNQIIQLSGELEETKHNLMASKNSANHFEGKFLRLFERFKELERQRENLFSTWEAHRDSFRVVVNTLTNLGAKDPNTDGL